ncbi:MAG: leucine-rich repeat protein [Clostridia bacterium]|nr:leucine-rich repeat protein [Clostridia bacterium]
MKKWLKAALSIALCVLLMTAAAPLAFAEESRSVQEGDWTYEYTSSGVKITAYSGSSANVTIPSALGGGTVTAIGDYVFSGCTTVQQITMPDTVTSIGEFSFEFCENLWSIRLSENLTAIPAGAFNADSALDSIAIPASVTDIGVAAFGSCTALESVTFSASSQLERIGATAFSRCTSLTEITLPDSLRVLGYPDRVVENMVFMNCTALESVYIPSGVTDIPCCTHYSYPDDPDYLEMIETGHAFADWPSTNIPWVFDGCDNLQVIYSDSETGIVADFARELVQFGAAAEFRLSAPWVQVEYVLNVDPNAGRWTDGSTDSKSYTGTAGTAIMLSDTPVRDGYSFNGWEVTDGDGTLDGCAYIFGESDGTVCAIWTQNHYTLTFDPNGGRWWNGLTNAQTYAQTGNSTFTMTKPPARDGYLFDGWEVVSGDGMLVDGNQIQLLGSLTGVVRAKWTLHMITLTLEPNGGWWQDNSTEAKTYTLNEGATFRLSESPVRSGHAFLGWKVTAGSGATSGNTITPSGNIFLAGTPFVCTNTDVTLTAQWSQKLITLTLDPNGGWWQDNSTEAKTYTLNEGTTFRLSESPVRSGHTFLGWKVTAGSGATSGDTPAPSDNILPPGTPFVCGNTDVTLTAQWEENTPQDQISVTIGDQIGVNLRLDLDARNAQNVTVVYKDLSGVEQRETFTDFSSLPRVEGGLYKIAVQIAPAQIADTVTVYIDGETLDANVKEYCNTLIAGGYEPEVAALAQAVLDYGQAASNFFDYTDETMSALNGLSADDAKAWQTQFSDTTGKIQSVSFMALTKPEFRFYMKNITEAEAAGYTVRAAYADGTITDTLNARFVKNLSGSILIEVTGVLAEEMDKTITVAIDGLGTITFAGNDFAKMMANNAATETLGAALYAYGEAAKACFVNA